MSDIFGTSASFVRGDTDGNTDGPDQRRHPVWVGETSSPTDLSHHVRPRSSMARLGSTSGARAAPAASTSTTARASNLAFCLLNEGRHPPARQVVAGS